MISYYEVVYRDTGGAAHRTISLGDSPDAALDNVPRSCRFHGHQFGQLVSVMVMRKEDAVRELQNDSGWN